MFTIPHAANYLTCGVDTLTFSNYSLYPPECVMTDERKLDDSRLSINHKQDNI